MSPLKRKRGPPYVSGHPQELQAAFERAVALHRQGRLEEAEAAYRRLLAGVAVPQPRLLGRLAQLCFERDDPDEALKLAAEALRLQDGDAFVHQVYGVTLRRLGRLDEALTSLRRAADLAPESATIRLSLGNVLSDLGHWAEAEAALRAAATETDPAPLSSLALVLRQQNRPAEAYEAAEAALRRDPAHVGARLERGMALLAQGRFEGFKDYEARLETAEIGPPRLPGTPWGGEPLAGKTLLLYPEQGLGDMIQFARFAPIVAARCAKVLLLMRRPLVRLMGTLDLGTPPAPVEVVPEGTPARPYDAFAPLMSVPARLGLDVQGIPANVPYLAAEPDRVLHWRRVARLDGPGLKVGIAWQGKPTSKMDVGRSFPVRHFVPIAALPGVRLVALQKEHGREQLAALPPGMVVEGLGEDFDAGPDAFIDTAAVMASLDLVITSDTAVAHLAGALGRPVWVVLRFGAEWRWLMDRDDSPWYPTMRLFRQERPGDWTGAFARMEGALRTWLEGRRPHRQPRVPISWGELLDKITILSIKAERIADPVKRANVAAELTALEAVRDEGDWRNPQAERLVADLRAVNAELWDVEDGIRKQERQGDFGPVFVDLARAVYRTNDRRAALKRALNEVLHSTLIEEKSYKY